MLVVMERDIRYNHSGKRKCSRNLHCVFLLLISTGFTSNPYLTACFEPPFHLEIILTLAVLIAFKAAIPSGKEIKAKIDYQEFFLDSSCFCLDDNKNWIHYDGLNKCLPHTVLVPQNEKDENIN